MHRVLVPRSSATGTSAALQSAVVLPNAEVMWTGLFETSAWIDACCWMYLSVWSEAHNPRQEDELPSDDGDGFCACPNEGLVEGGIEQVDGTKLGSSRSSAGTGT